jgi:tryptophan-rich sensory protein
MASARVDRIAAWLLAPYLAWVAYAATLNGGIVWMN